MKNFLFVLTLLVATMYSFAQTSWNMPSQGSSDTIYTCSGTLYDDGGPTNFYSCNPFYLPPATMVIYPATTSGSSSISISGTYDVEPNYDFLYVYDGVGENPSNLLGTFTGNGTIPTIVSSTGPLTIVFSSDDIMCDFAGFALNISCLSCIPLSGLVSSAITSNAALISWNSVGPNSNYELVYGPAGFNPDSATNVIALTDTFYNMSGLVPNTLYDVYVRQICSSSESSIWSTLSFCTTQIPATLPYSYDFESDVENSNWTLFNNVGGNQWVIGASVNNTTDGDSALYISQDNGITHGYNHSQSAVVWAYRDFIFGDDTQFILNFDWICYGGAGWDNDNLFVYVGDPAPVFPSTNSYNYNIPSSITQLAILNSNSQWTNSQYILNSNYANKIVRLYFCWVNNDYSLGLPPAAIDNISIIGSNCLRPVFNSVSNQTTTSVSVSFSPGSQFDSQWEYVYGPYGFDPATVTPISTTSTTFTISGLSASTIYQIYFRTVCSDENSIWSDVASFSTACGEISSLPYVETFDSYDVAVYDFPPCWSRYAYSPEEPHLISGMGPYSSPNYLYFYCDSWGALNNMAITPQISSAFPINTLRTVFKYKGSVNYPIQVGIMSNPLNDQTYTPIDTIYLTAADVWQTFEVAFNNYQGNGQYVAFKMSSATPTSMAYGYIDHVIIDAIPSCNAPTNLVVSSLIDTSVQLTWSAGGTETEWQLSYGAPGFTPGDSNLITISNTPSFLLTGLTPNTSYEVYVRSVCDEEEYSGWILTSALFTTDCSQYPAPFTENFNNYTFPPACWNVYDALASSVFSGTEDLGHYTYVSWMLNEDRNGLEGNHASVNIYGSSLHQWFVSPTIDLSTLENPYLFFELALTDYYNSDPILNPADGLDDKFMVVLYGENDTAWVASNAIEWNNTGTGNYVYNNISTLGQLISIPLLSCGNKVKIAFYAESTVYNADNDLHIGSIYVGELLTCLRPEQPFIINSSSNSITIGWQPGADEGAWQVVSGLPGFNPDSALAIVSQDTFITIQNLLPNQQYQFYVRAICDDNEYSSWSNPYTAVTTQANVATIPYSCDFEVVSENSNWTFVNNLSGNNWYIDAAANNTTGGTNALYISMNNGVSNQYNTNAACVVWAYRDFTFTAANEFLLSFDYRVAGEENYNNIYDYLSVYIADPYLVTPINGNSTFTPPIGSTLLGQFSSQPTWTNASIVIDGSYSGTTKRIYFLWVNDFTDGTNPPAAIDNMIVEALVCVRPTAVSANNVTIHTADIDWTPGQISDNEWQVVCVNTGASVSSGTPITVNGTTNTSITGLTANTLYDVYVRTICSDNEMSTWSEPITFRTSCDVISQIPYFENFDSYQHSSYPTCWSRLSTYVGMALPYITYYMSSSESNSMYFFADLTSYNIAILPPISIPINTLQLSFYTFSQLNAVLDIGVMTDPSDPATFVSVDQYNVQTNFSWEYVEIPLITYTGNGQYIAIRFTGNYLDAYIDDILVDSLPSCINPYNLTATPDQYSVELEWLERNIPAATEWTIEYGPAGFIQGSGTQIIANSNPFTINGLTSNTLYDYYVKANCGTDDLSEWSKGYRFRTLACPSAQSCSYTLSLSDEYGDGWDASAVIVNADGVDVVSATVIDDSLVVSIPVCNGVVYQLLWQSGGGDYDYEASFNLYDANDSIIYTCVDGSTLSSGVIFTFTAVCDVEEADTCAVPSNLVVTYMYESSSAIATWTAGGTETQWMFEYKNENETEFTQVLCNTNTYSIQNIEFGLLYNIRVKAVCSNGLESNYTNEEQFIMNGIDDLQLFNSISLYPNPAVEKIEMIIHQDNLQNIEAVLYDVYGKKIKAISIIDNHSSIDISTLSSGVYFIQVSTDKGIITKKFIKK